MRTKEDTLYIKDVWEYYSYKLLAANPTWVGVNQDKIKNYRIYAKYTDENGKKRIEEVLTYKVFADTMRTFLDLAKQQVVEGGTLKLKGHLGIIAARRVQRDHSKKTINFNRTNQQEKVWSDKSNKMVPSKIIYFTSDDWCRVGWHKIRRWVKNVVLYEFRPAKDLKSGKGFNQMLSAELIKNPNTKFKFIYYPLKRKKRDGVQTD